MARIVFAWEFGAGLGHILYDLPLAKKLLGRGHEVFCVMKNVVDAEKVMGPHGVKVLQAPVWQVQVKRLENTFNYADTLFNHGYLFDGALQGMAKAWRNLFEKIKPELLIVDHAPTALIAARGTEIKTALYGTGFFAPPRQEPMPSIIPWVKAPDGALEQSEKKIVAKINDVLQGLDAPKLEALCELFTVDENFLCTFPELDHYQGHVREKYWGPVINLPEGESPAWPDTGNNRKIFCYIKAQYPHLEEVLLNLQQSEAAVIVFLKNAPRKIKTKFTSPSLKFTERPVNMKEVCGECDLVVCHAGHGTIAVTLLHGKPLLLLPEHNQLEQVLIARNIALQKLGLCIFTRQKVRAYKGAIDKIFSDFEFTEKARAFAYKYKDVNPSQQLEEIAARCEELIAQF